MHKSVAKQNRQLRANKDGAVPYCTTMNGDIIDDMVTFIGRSMVPLKVTVHYRRLWPYDVG